MQTNRTERLILIALIALGACAAIVLPLAAAEQRPQGSAPAQAEEAPRAPEALVQAEQPARAE